MKTNKFDVIIVGGSYSGLSASMALGRALRNVLVIDGGKPANRFAPRSHNFLTHDGRAPRKIAALARQQLKDYSTLRFQEDFVVGAHREGSQFLVATASGREYVANKIILATGVVDLMPDIPGFAACWGKSVLHCPYCHGYEVRDLPTGILGNGDYAFEFAMLISNWTRNLRIYTNGPSALAEHQLAKLTKHNIHILEDRIRYFSHEDGMIHQVHFEDGAFERVDALYARPATTQHSDVWRQLGCELTQVGYIKVDESQRTSVPGVFACGDNVSRMRTVANAVSLGTIAGMMVNKELVEEQ